MLLKKKKLLALTLITVAVCVIFLFYFFLKSSTVPTLSSTKPNSFDAKNAIKSETSGSVTAKQSNSDVKKDVYKDVKENEMSQTDWKVFKSWTDRHGYLNKDDVKVYESYSKSILNELAEKGDLIALRVLTRESLVKGDDQSAFKFLKKSAVYGSTAALDTMAILTAPGYEDNTDEKRRAALLETFAVTRLMALRGDKSLSQIATREATMAYEPAYGRARLTSEENTAVDERARELYDELQQERYKLGLGDFDNDEPFSMKKFFGFD